MDMMNILIIGGTAYVTVVAALLRIFQSIRKKDELMRAITDTWIKESRLSLDSK